MRIDELTTAMRQAEEHYEVTAPDLATLRRLGARRRRTRQAGLAAAVAGLVAAVAAGVLAGHGLVDRSEKPQPVKPSGPKVLSAFERRVLTDVPGSYAVDGTVVMPVPVDPDDPGWMAKKVDRFVGRLAPLGWHAMTDLANDGPTYTREDYPAYLRQPPPDDTQVIQDNGPMRIGCRPLSTAPCGLFFILTDEKGGRYTGYRLGDDDFLRPGKPMELIPSGTFESHRLQPAVVGGMYGTSTTRVVLRLKDGTEQDATVDRGKVAPGATVFWGLLDAKPVRATAYDASGDIVEDHTLTPCDDPVDCQTR